MNSNEADVQEAYHLHQMLRAEFERKGIEKAIIFSAVAQIVVQINYDAGVSPEELGDVMTQAAKEYRKMKMG